MIYVRIQLGFTTITTAAMTALDGAGRVLAGVTATNFQRMQNQSVADATT